MITNEQNREYTRCKKLQDFLGMNETVYGSFQPFADEATDFDNNFTALVALIPNRNVVVNGITADKRGLKQKIAAGAALICRKTMAYAVRYNNPELAAQTNTREDIIFRMKDAALLGYVQSVVNLV